MKNALRLLLLGLMTWAVPFFAAIFFMDQSGQLTVDKYLFKTIMILIGGLIGAFAMILYFKKIDNEYLKHGLLIGFSWLVINIVIDLLVLVPMSQMTYSDYFNQIGLRYLMQPIMGILVGHLLDTKIGKVTS